ncbi:hypothetical protein [Candidatus Tisiphia endosymbiont of Parasteatoda lunata]|uniref:hypothetical protein n=1 Tax=Candidatus Tisiphia endosymbiont of Parasteatoda lunata TaxID=3066275 RepID=UPI00313DD8D1
MAHLESVTTQKNISVKCKILLKNICMIHSYLFLIRYLKFMLKRRTASAGFFSQSGTIKIIIQLVLEIDAVSFLSAWLINLACNPI